MVSSTKTYWSRTWLWVAIVICSCRFTPEYIPAAGGNTLVPVPFGASGCPFGYYEYLPDGYALDSTYHYPLLIFLHGASERGDSKKDPEALEKLLRTGLPAMIKAGRFSPPEPMVVIALQANVGYDPDNIHKAIKWLQKQYMVDASRTYLTSLSMGAIATFKYLGSYGSKAKVAAAVPICGSAQVGRADRIGRTPIWIFHGQADHIIPVSQSHEMAEALRRLEGKRHARLTIFPGVGHHSWDMVYDGTGRGQEDPTYDIFDQDIYSWMLQYHRD